MIDTLAVHTTAISIVHTGHTSIGPIGVDAQGLCPTTALIVRRITDPTDLRYALTFRRCTISIVTASNTSSGVPIGHAKWPSAIAASAIRSVTWHARFVYAFARTGLGTIEVSATSDARIAIRTRIANGRIALTASIRA